MADRPHRRAPSQEALDAAARLAELKRENAVMLNEGKAAPLNEASLQRAYNHFLKDGFGSVTSWRDDVSPGATKTRQQNNADFRELKQRVKAAGFGFIQVTGVWEDEATKVRVEEPSLFIPVKKRDGTMAPDELRALVIRLGQDYEQSAVLWVWDQTAEQIQTTHPVTGARDATVTKRYTRFVPRFPEFRMLYTRMKRFSHSGKGALQDPLKRFALESVVLTPGPRSFSEAMAREAEGEMHFDLSSHPRARPI